jgi:antitoxin ParD1/3/4
MKVKDIKRGQNMKRLEQPLTEQEKLARLNQLFGTWKNQSELTEIFAEIDKELHVYQGRIIDLIDNQDNE